MKLERPFVATGIGSLPHKDPDKAAGWIVENIVDIPFWPQLPKRSYLENMYVQFAENLPGVVVDEQAKRIWVDTSADLTESIQACYEHYLAEDLEYFKIGPERAPGFYSFCDILKNSSAPKPQFLKGHVTGPISFGLTVTDQNKRSILYDTELAEVMEKTLQMKARWQIKYLKEVSGNVIIFIDEPYLVSIGSSVVNINSEDVKKRLSEFTQVIKNDGALTGLHCCGNTDWGLVCELGIDVVNFDAYNYATSISLYPKQVKRFLEGGGSIAWGIVPTSKDVEKEDGPGLKVRLESAIEGLVAKGIDKELIMGSSIVTPSCGCGTLSEDLAERILLLTLKVSQRMRG
ncbi:MAG: hypothetical protein HQ593_00065 [Candidatus Omnitrophica bacterium]|nr:hypothetical protein [Candidatus Omnitrophota bacterium]